MTARKNRRKNAGSQADLGASIIVKSPETKSEAAGMSNSQSDSTYDDHKYEYKQNDGFSKPDKEEKEKAEKRRLKKERQKEKKMAKKITAQRKESMMILLKDGTISTDTIFLSSSRSGSHLSVAPQESLSLLGSPQVTAEYFLHEIRCLLWDARSRLFKAICGSDDGRNVGDVLGLLAFSIFVGLVVGASYLWKISEDEESLQNKQDIVWYAYWIFLGVLSSIGFGSGLHTFVLYLGPFIAKVTLAAEECSTLNFPRPPYPNQIICPHKDLLETEAMLPAVWEIMDKVRWESIAWGFGTALGELPPYFMARASQLSGSEDSSIQAESGCKILRGIRDCMKSFVLGVGFWGILLCASIPNPLFDLAGITCGHFLVPFMTFFGATVIGKSLIKSQLQTLFVILAFNEDSLNSVLSVIGKIPNVGGLMQREFTDFMNYQKATVHEKKVAKSGGLLKIAVDALAFMMIVYFAISIVNGLARRYQKRISRSEQSKKTSKSRKLRKRGESQTQL